MATTRNGGRPKFKIRIVGFKTKAAGAFKFNPLNWRRHGDQQRAALREMLGDVGWVQGVIENKRTGNLIDGHARIEEALREGPDQAVPYLIVDLSPAEEKAILATLDPIGAMAEIDQGALDRLYRETFSEMPEFEQSLNRLRNNLEGAPDQTNDEWIGMPTFEAGENSFKIIINFRSEKAREQFAKKFPVLKFLQRGPRAWFSWYPFKIREDLISLKYEESAD